LDEISDAKLGRALLQAQGVDTSNMSEADVAKVIQKWRYRNIDELGTMATATIQ
jgi:hypothetical protein